MNNLRKQARHTYNRLRSRKHPPLFENEQNPDFFNSNSQTNHERVNEATLGSVDLRKARVGNTLYFKFLETISKFEK
jgi:hypothetical protein